MSSGRRCSGIAAIIAAATSRVVPTVAAGSGSLAVPIPNAPTLAGRSLFLQWAVLDPQGPLFGDFALSGGLQVQLGN